MPFKSEAQRRYLYANHPEIAKKWQAKYHALGGIIDAAYMKCGGPVYKQDGGLTTAQKRKLARHGRLDKASQRYNEGSTEITARDVLEFVPIIGEVLTLSEINDALNNENYAAAGLLTVALGLGFIPGIGDLAAKPFKMAAKHLPADVTGVARAIKDGDVEFLKGWKNSDEAQSVGARAVGAPKPFYIKNADGSVEEVQMTIPEFVQQFGANANTAKRAAGKGQLPDGRAWSRTGDFTDARAKTGETVVKEQEAFIENPLNVQHVKGTRMSWKGMSETKRREIEKTVDELMRDELGLVPDRPDRFIDDEGVQILRPDDTIGITLFDETRALQDKIAEGVWPKIVNALEPYKSEGPEFYNKLMQWAKNRSTKVFGFHKDGKMISPGVEARLGGAQIGGARKFKKYIEDNPEYKWIENIKADDKVKNRIANTKVIERIQNLKGKDLTTPEGHKAVDDLISSYIQLGANEVLSNKGPIKVLNDQMNKYSGVSLGSFLRKVKTWSTKNRIPIDISEMDEVLSPGALANEARTIFTKGAPQNKDFGKVPGFGRANIKTSLIAPGTAVTGADSYFSQILAAEAVNLFGNPQQKAALRKWQKKRAAQREIDKAKENLERNLAPKAAPPLRNEKGLIQVNPDRSGRKTVQVEVKRNKRPNPLIGK